MGDFNSTEDTSNKELIIFEYRKTSLENANRLFNAFRPIVRYFKEQDSPTTCFYLLKEKSSQQEVTWITVLRFESDDRLEEYRLSPAYNHLHKACLADELLVEPIQIQRLSSVAGFPYRTDSVRSFPGIHVAMAKITYAPNTRSVGIEQWKNVARSVEQTETEGTYTYWFLVDPLDESVLYSLERYRDESYLWDVHVPSTAIQENIKNQKDIRTGLVLRGFESLEGSVLEDML